MKSPYAPRLAVDIGGTFTDVVLETAPGEFLSGKYLTTHAAPEQAVMTGVSDLLQRSGTPAEAVGVMVHGTTLATNALIERKGAKIALITTRGFRDSLEIAFEHRFEVSDLYMVRPEPLVPRNLRLEVTERMAADGSVLLDLDDASVAALVPVLRENGIEAVAVCLLHSYANPAHEARVGAILRAAMPELRITLSARICPEMREYERGSTACANAYVQPVMEGYLRRLESSLRQIGVGCQVMLMMSSGGLTSLDIACEQPIKLVESGPAGGAVLASQIARELGLDKVIAFDMGGTTAKLVLIDDGAPQRSRHLEVARAYRFLRGSGMPLRVPVIDLVEIGAGGGSLGGVDALGGVSVGPESAGSEPGPACYGRGGLRPAVTDADLVVGKIDPEGFAGGSFRPDVALAQAALSGHIGDRLGMDVRGAAVAMIEVVDENMANAARVHATDNGVELEGRTMIAFGGAAPMHAARIAQKLRIERIVIPRGAGVGSAHGFLMAPVAYEAVRTRLMLLGGIDRGALSAVLDEMRDEASGFVRSVLPADQPLTEEATLYVRYRGQGHEVQIALPQGLPEMDIQAEIRSRFEAEYVRHFGRIIPGMDIECLTWTLTVSGPRHPAAPALGDAAAQPAPSALRSHKVIDLATIQELTAEIHSRPDLAPGTMLQGPVLITEAETNTTVPRGFAARIDARGNIILTAEEAAQ